MTDETFISRRCPICGAEPGVKCSLPCGAGRGLESPISVGPLTTGDHDGEWHERRPWKPGDKRLCNIRSGLRGPCELPWGHTSVMHESQGAIFYNDELVGEHARRQAVVIAALRDLSPQRRAFKPERVLIDQPPDAASWTIGEVKVTNRCGLCGDEFGVRAKHVCSKAAIDPVRGTMLTTVDPPTPAPDPSVHRPKIARTMVESPGNRVLVRGCACGSPVMTPEAYAEHVGWPVEAVLAVLNLYGIAADYALYGDGRYRDRLPSHAKIARKIDEWLTVRR